MSNLVHKIHEYIVLLVSYLAIFTVIGFMPIPLFTFFGGDNLTEIDHNPLFEYFNHYQISTDTILQNVYTNVYISQNKNDIQDWQIDNAVLWADAISFKLTEEGIPVIKKIITSVTESKVESLQALHLKSTLQSSLLPSGIEHLLLKLKSKFQNLLPVKSVTQDARQWIILALNSNEKTIKKELKELVSQFLNDNFLVITQTPINLNKKSFQIFLPDFNIKQAKRILSEGLEITQKQAQILLIDNQKSLWSLNNKKGESPEFSLKSLLEENHFSFNDVSDKEAAIMEKLCQEGKVKIGKNKLNLVDYGVRIKNKNYQWVNDLAQLNYQLQKETLCGKAVWIDGEASDQDQNNLKQNEKHKQNTKQKVTKESQQEKQQNGQNEESSDDKQKVRNEPKSNSNKKTEIKQQNGGSEKNDQNNGKQDEQKPNQQKLKEKKEEIQEFQPAQSELILLD